MSRNDYKLIRAGKSYKKALPPEKWHIVEHFLEDFSKYATIAVKTGKKMNVKRFLKEFRKSYI